METYEEEEKRGKGEGGSEGGREIERENIRKSKKMHLWVYIIFFFTPYIQAPIENFEKLLEYSLCFTSFLS